MIFDAISWLQNGAPESRPPSVASNKYIDGAGMHRLPLPKSLKITNLEGVTPGTPCLPRSMTFA
jgi:hypothetical protein